MPKCFSGILYLHLLDDLPLLFPAIPLGKRWKTPIQANNKKEKAELCN